MLGLHVFCFVCAVSAAVAAAYFSVPSMQKGHLMPEMLVKTCVITVNPQVSSRVARANQSHEMGHV